MGILKRVYTLTLIALQGTDGKPFTTQRPWGTPEATQDGKHSTNLNRHKHGIRRATNLEANLHINTFVDIYIRVGCSVETTKTLINTCAKGTYLIISIIPTPQHVHIPPTPRSHIADARYSETDPNLT